MFEELIGRILGEMLGTAILAGLAMLTTILAVAGVALLIFLVLLARGRRGPVFWLSGGVVAAVAAWLLAAMLWTEIEPGLMERWESTPVARLPKTFEGRSLMLRFDIDPDAGAKTRAALGEARCNRCFTYPHLLLAEGVVEFVEIGRGETVYRLWLEPGHGDCDDAPLPEAVRSFQREVMTSQGVCLVGEEVAQSAADLILDGVWKMRTLPRDPYVAFALSRAADGTVLDRFDQIDHDRLPLPDPGTTPPTRRSPGPITDLLRLTDLGTLPRHNDLGIRALIAENSIDEATLLEVLDEIFTRYRSDSYRLACDPRVWPQLSDPTRKRVQRITDHMMHTIYGQGAPKGRVTCGETRYVPYDLPETITLHPL